ncbi:MAG: hypothetical protein ACTSQ0_08345 [Candidatus Heimdallarchaeota archaeon]
MNFWPIFGISFLGIFGIVGVIYLIVLLISKGKDSFNLHTNGKLLGALISFSGALTIITSGLISFSGALTIITSGIAFALPQNILVKIIVVICSILVASVPAIVFFVFLAFYLKSVEIDESSVKAL